jgi:curved DNA-binding protein CbpA
LEYGRMRDPYEILGISRSATEDDIKQGFRRLAKQLHPDANSKDPRAAKRFAELNSAHAILGNKAKRQAFDRGEIDAEGKMIRRHNPRATRPRSGNIAIRFMMAASILVATPTLVDGSLTQGEIHTTGTSNHGGSSGFGVNDMHASALLADQPYRRVLARSTPDAADDPTPAITNAVHVIANARAVARLRQAQQLKECGLRSEQVDQLIKLGEKFLAQGDVGAARRLLEHAARARNARATLMLGATYDPDGLRRMGVVGIQPDLEQAHFWYTRALEFGCREASLRLLALAQPAR